jgi:hypothetical protein
LQAIKSFRLHWGVPVHLPNTVKEADTLALRIELASLASNKMKASFMRLGIEPLYGSAFHIHDVWSADRSYREFMTRFELLGPSGRKR